MQYKNLGNSGLKVSVVGLGCNNLGRSVDAAGTAAIVARCLDSGITFFDTADTYGNRGLSETYLGAALKPHRHDIVLATKVNGQMGDGPYKAGASRRYLIPAVEASLRRLETDYIDLLQMHHPDPLTPIEETLDTLDAMVKSGKVRYLGCSNYTASDIVEASWTARTRHATPYISSQNRYSLLEQGIRDELLPVCSRHGVGLLPYYPLAAGLLTGKYRPGEPPAPGTRLSKPNPFYDGMLNERNFSALARLETFAAERGHSILELAIGWLASQPAVGSVICGATRPEQVEANARASTWRLTADEMKLLDSLMERGSAGA